MTKSGLKTTEFWVALAAAVTVVMDKHLGLDLSPTVKILTGSLAAIYALARSWVKK